MEAPLTLLARAEAVGFRFTLRESELLVRGPSKGHDSLLADLKAAKPELIDVLRMRTLADSPSSAVGAGDPAIEHARAAGLLARSVVFESCAPSSPRDCYCCGGSRWWRLSPRTPWICARCHPSARANAELEWHDAVKPAGDLRTVTPPEASVPVTRAREGGQSRG